MTVGCGYPVNDAGRHGCGSLYQAAGRNPWSRIHDRATSVFAGPLLSRQLGIRRALAKPQKGWWARQGLNLWPLPCQGSALPLSYAPIRAKKYASAHPSASLARDSARHAGFNMAMDMPVAASLAPPSPIVVLRPLRQTIPVVFASPHSGRSYPYELLAASRLDSLSLRRSEDSFVDELFAAAPEHGAPLLAATFPRAWCDANREPWELDPAMFADRLPSWVNTTSARVGAGLGTIARVVASGEAIYRDKLSFADAERRIRACWQPFHDALAALIAETRANFGHCLLVDCHSMPTHGHVNRSGARPADFVLGDAHGTACAPRMARLVETMLIGAGLQRTAQRPLCRRLHYPPLRPAARGRACAADRDRARTLYGRGADRAAARVPGSAAQHDPAHRRPGRDRAHPDRGLSLRAKKWRRLWRRQV